MTKKIKNFTLAASASLTTLLWALPALAGDKVIDNLQGFAEKMGFTTVDTTDPNVAKNKIGELIGSGLSAVLSFLGVIFIILIIYAGFLWMTSRGNDQQIEKSKNMIQAGFIGVMIVALAYGFTKFIGGIVTGLGLFQ